MYATKVSDQVYLLDTFALGHARTVAAYVVKGPRPTLVDCGYASSYASVLAGLSEIGVSPSDLRYVIPTHVHLDHAGATGRLLKEMPNAEVIAHEKGVPHLVDPARLIESATRVFGEATMELYGLPLPVDKERITAVGKETSLDLGDGMTALLMHTPGHAPHQISVSLDGPKMILTADAVGIAYPDLKTVIPTTPPPSFDPAQLVLSVGLLERTDPKGLLLPHYGLNLETDRVFRETREKVPEWVKDVGEMKSAGKELDGISESMEARVKKEAGVDELAVYARVSVRSSVMGILHYLSKNP